MKFASLFAKKPKQKTGPKEGKKYNIQKTTQDWVDAIELFKSLKPPMTNAQFLKSSISGDLFSGTQSEQVSFSKRLKDYDAGKYQGKNLNVKRLSHIRRC